MAMSHAEVKRQSMPRGTLVIFWSVIVIALVTAGIGRLTGAANSEPTAPMVTTRELLFHDQPDGTILVFDARDTVHPIEVVAQESNYFLRATMRGLAQQRVRQDASREVPFRLTEWADGRLTLEDPIDNRRVDMEAFGVDNEKVFAKLLLAKAGS